MENNDMNELKEFLETHKSSIEKNLEQNHKFVTIQINEIKETIKEFSEEIKSNSIKIAVIESEKKTVNNDIEDIKSEQRSQKNLHWKVLGSGLAICTFMFLIFKYFYSIVKTLPVT